MTILPPPSRNNSSISMRYWSFFLSFLLIIFFSFSAAVADEHTLNPNYKIKLVFPFGGDATNISVCSSQHQTNNGCCEAPKSIYTYALGAKGCCMSPNEVMGTVPNERCCTPWKPADQPRWGQTPTTPCGGYCGTPNVVSSYNGYSSCCSNCADVDGVPEFQTTSSVCGTCCSRIPVSCGNIGERVCESDTGLTYCSQTSLCNGPGEYMFGSSGEGGFTCCSACENGVRYDQTTSSCGSCCETDSEVLSFMDKNICCPECGADEKRFGQSDINTCGICASCGEGATYDTENSTCVCDETNDYHGVWHKDESNGEGNGCFVCGTGAIFDTESNTCMCNTENSYYGVWQKDIGDGKGNGCQLLGSCDARMQMAGYNSAKYTINGNTIAYKGLMTVSQDLNLSGCDLIITDTHTNISNLQQFPLFIESGVTLQVKSVTSTLTLTGFTQGNGPQYSPVSILNLGTLIAETDVVGIVKLSNSSLYYSLGANGISNSNGIIKAKTISGTVYYGIGISSSAGELIAQTITGASDKSSGCGLRLSGNVEVEADTITGTGGGTAVEMAGASIKAKTIHATSTGVFSVYGVGLSLWGGTTIEAETIHVSATASGGDYLYGIKLADHDYFSPDMVPKINTSVITVQISGTALASRRYAISGYGVITADEIRYCPNKDNLQTLNGTLICLSGCACTN